MLIYNFEKKFIGIDEKDLKALGLNSLESLLDEVNDFADLFVKTPGCISNFQHVHWIDFINCAEPNEESKAIINIKNRNFKCHISISTTYLVDNPTQKAYLVNLERLTQLSDSESEKISADISQRPKLEAGEETTSFNIPTPAVQNKTQEEVFESQTYEKQSDTLAPSLAEDPYENKTEVPKVEITEDPYESQTPIDIDLDEDIEVENANEQNYYEETPIAVDNYIEVDDEEPASATTVSSDDVESSYVYDPTIASEQLGLPLDLIEEFIEDFVQQAKEFKDSLYEALEINDSENIKVLSHKLKGVAANLRIEDALEALDIINASDDESEIRNTLNSFYKIISKLANEDISYEAPAEEVAEVPEIVQEVAALQETVVDEPVVSVQENKQEETIDLEDDLLLVEELETEETAEEENIVTEDTKDDLLDVEDDLLLIEDTEDENLLLVEDDEAIEFDEEPLLDIADDEESVQINYSKELVANEIGMDIESFNELYDDYIDESKEILKTIEASAQENDLETAKKYAIRLKGMSDNMRVTNFLAELQAIIDAHTTTEVTNATDKITTALQQHAKTGE